MEFVGLIVFIIFLTAVSLMMISSWETTVVDARKEDKRVFEERVEAEVERRFDNAINSAEYRVHYKPVVMVNESDIDWD